MYVIFSIIKATKKLCKHGHCNDSQPTQGNYRVGLTGGIPHRLRIFKRGKKDPSRNQGCQKVGFEPATLGSVVQSSNHSANQLQLPNRRKIFAIYAPTLLMYIVASPDLNPRGGVSIT